MYILQVPQTTIRQFARPHQDGFHLQGFWLSSLQKFGPNWKSFVFPQFWTIRYCGYTSTSQGWIGTRLTCIMAMGFVGQTGAVTVEVSGLQWAICLTLQSEVSIPMLLYMAEPSGLTSARTATILDCLWLGSSVRRPKFWKACRYWKLKLLQLFLGIENKNVHKTGKPKLARLHNQILQYSAKDYHTWKQLLLCATKLQTIFAEDLNTIGLNHGMLRSECVGHLWSFPLVDGMGILQARTLHSDKATLGAGSQAALIGSSQAIEQEHIRLWVSDIESCCCWDDVDTKSWN